MKAAVYHTYGPPEVVRIEEVATPRPKPAEVLIRIRATTVSSADWRVRSLVMPRGFGVMGRPVFGLLGPRQPILGTELAGEVAAVGTEVTRFRVGEAVVAYPGSGLGCHAQFRTMPQDGRVVPKPAALSFEQAAAMCFGGTTALYFLRDAAQVQRGERVLIIGASGALGSAAVQLAKVLGGDVTGVCSGANADLVRSIGADRIVDYTREDAYRAGEGYDVILDTVGQASFARCRPILKEGGRLVLAVADLPQLLTSGSKAGKRNVIAGPAKETVEQLAFLAQLAETGAFKPVIDSRYPLEQIVEAHKRVESHRKRGSVVVTVRHDDRL